MDREELKQRLDEAGVRPESYHLYGAHMSERYVLLEQGQQWSVFYSERGLETGKRTFDSESEACKYLFGLLTGDPTTRD
ncbi:MAG: hypothetical protein M3N53_06280 [Actinomycetota bacterium]|nr:hypothetical protein [Actinomycetota bacterium]